MDENNICLHFFPELFRVSAKNIYTLIIIDNLVTFLIFIFILIIIIIIIPMAIFGGTLKRNFVFL